MNTPCLRVRAAVRGRVFEKTVGLRKRLVGLRERGIKMLPDSFCSHTIMKNM